MLSYLVSIIQNIPIPEANSLLIWQSAEIITAFVTKDDGTLMDDECQIKKFCDFIFEKEGRQLCGRLYKENDPAPYYSTTDEVNAINLMVIRWNAGTYACANQKKCKLCNHTYQVRGVIQHVCGNSYCYQCNQHHPPNNRALGKNYCYIQKAKIHPKDFLRVLYVFYDIETIQKVLKRLGKRANSCSEPSTSSKRARVEPSEDEPVASCSHQSEPSEDEPVASCSHQSESNPSCAEDSGIMHATNMDHTLIPYIHQL
uniref:Uncharacterized protein n=1 Tax=Panagrolaimus superbus TaxID=310955 RepID=A0A914YYF8_9BILA